MRFAPHTLALALVFAAGSSVAGSGKTTTYSGMAAMPTDPKEREIAALFDRWNAALATGKPSAVTALYAPNGVLQPTVSNEVRVGPQAIQRYFDDFLKLQPVGTVNFREIRLLDDNTALDSGVYTFRINKDGERQQVQARYTYVYEKVDGQWKIANHHSSAMPEQGGKAEEVSEEVAVN